MIIDGSGKISGSTSVWETGDFKMRAAAAPNAGWIAATGGTIGSASSGATNRANDDTFDLFALWWTDFTDAVVPIQTNTGGVSSRGASALLDWNAGKRMTVFDARDRVPRVSGTAFSNGRLYASTTQPHRHKLPMGFDGQALYTWGDGAGAPIFGSYVESGAYRAAITGLNYGFAPARIAYSETVFDNTSGESAPNTIAHLGCYKL